MLALNITRTFSKHIQQECAHCEILCVTDSLTLYHYVFYVELLGPLVLTSCHDTSRLSVMTAPDLYHSDFCTRAANDYLNCR